MRVLRLEGGSNIAWRLSIYVAWIYVKGSKFGLALIEFCDLDCVKYYTLVGV